MSVNKISEAILGVGVDDTTIGGQFPCLSDFLKKHIRNNTADTCHTARIIPQNACIHSSS